MSHEYHPDGSRVSRVLATVLDLNTTSLTLLERVKNEIPNSNGGLCHDNEAWCRLVDLYTPMLFNWSLRTGLNESESEDLVQEVFVILLTKLANFERQRDGSFRKWLQVITVNKCQQRFRRKQLPKAAHDREFDPLSAVADPSMLTDFWEMGYRRELCLRAMQIMQSQFPEPIWKSCWEHIVQDRPAADVASDLGITANAVRVYSSRVLARLRTELSDLLDD